MDIELQRINEQLRWQIETFDDVLADIDQANQPNAVNVKNNEFQVRLGDDDDDDDDDD